MGIPKPEETLLKNNTQGFVAQNRGGLLFAQSGFEAIAITSGLKCAFLRHSGKFKQVKRAVDGVHGKETGRHVSAFHSKQEVRHIDVRNALQGPPADSPIEIGEPC